MSTTIRSEISKKNPYYISEHRHLELKNLCLQYNELKKADPEDKRVKMIEFSAMTADDILGVYVLKGVANNRSYDVLKVRYNIPCCKEVYYNVYRCFFWIGGMLTATVLAVKATPKAIRLLEDAREEKDDDLTAKEIVKAAWKPYLPDVGTAIASAAMIIGAKKAYSVQHTALAAACSLSETALKEYRAKVEETLGEKKAREIDDAIAKAQLKRKV